MAQAKRDQNYVTTLIGVSSIDGVTPVLIHVDPTTHRVLVDSPGLTGTKIYYVSDTSGGAVTRKLTFSNGLLISET